MSLAALKAFHEMVVSGEEKAEGPGVEETRSGIQSCQLYLIFVLGVFQVSREYFLSVALFKPSSRARVATNKSTLFGPDMH